MIPIRIVTRRRLAALEDAAARLAALQADMAGTEETLRRVRVDAARRQQQVDALLAREGQTP